MYLFLPIVKELFHLILKASSKPKQIPKFPTHLPQKFNCKIKTTIFKKSLG